MPLPLLGVMGVQAVASSPSLSQWGFLSRCINQDVQTKPHLLSGLEFAPFHSKFLSSAFVSRSWCGALSHSKLLLVAFRVWEAIVVFNSLTSLHRVDQSWQGASTTPGISATPSPTRTGQLLAVLKFSQNTLNWDSQGMSSISYN